MIGKENTTIVNGAGKKADIGARGPDQGSDRGDHLGRTARKSAVVVASSTWRLRKEQRSSTRKHADTLK